MISHIYLLRWLILLQPWKAPRLYDWYLSLRSPDPKLEAPVTGDASRVCCVLFYFFSQFYRHCFGIVFIFLNEELYNRIAAFETISCGYSQ